MTGPCRILGRIWGLGTHRWGPWYTEVADPHGHTAIQVRYCGICMRTQMRGVR